jgi:hypothetical protein
MWSFTAICSHATGIRSWQLRKPATPQRHWHWVRDLLSEVVISRLRDLLQGRQPFVVPVTAIEVAGFNAIPDAMTQEIGERLRLTPLSGTIIQSNKVAHTKADGWHRLVTPATFIGTVVAGADYLLVDDHIGFGGTLANLRGHIEANGGHVLGMTTLTETGGGREIAIRRETLLVYNRNMGTSLNNSGITSSDTTSTASPTLRQDIYLVLNPLTPSELAWLKQQSAHVAEVFRQSMSERTDHEHTNRGATVL